MISKNSKICVVIAHPDDETIGCGGLISKAISNECKVKIVLPLRSNGKRSLTKWQQYIVNFKKACKEYGAEPVILNPLVFEHHIEKNFWKLTDRINTHLEWADTIITHSPGDVHASHRAISHIVEISTRPFRINKNVIFFEIPTSTDQGYENNFFPNLFVELSEQDVTQKCNAFKLYKNEFAPGRKPEDLRLHCVLRGRQIGAGYAEVFKIARLYS
ncbi:MAG: PIG-L family deacetylase [Ignavibacteria bacterium]